MPCNTIIAIILASGKGTRFGMPKAEAGYGGKSFVQHIRDTLHAAGLSRIVLADSYNSPDMLATLRLAVSDIMLGESSDASGYLIFPVDFPFVRQETLQSLIHKHLEHPNAVIHPLYQNRRGHPIIIPASTNLLADDEGKGLREVLSKNHLTHIDVPVDDIGTISNINTPEDLQQWTQKN
jgi:CTP:molybdopterin cytidylyltransferase MocA